MHVFVVKGRVFEAPERAANNALIGASAILFRQVIGFFDPEAERGQAVNHPLAVEKCEVVGEGYGG
jgi:hypothetical protein